MNSEYSDDEQSLREQVETSEYVLGDLERELRAVDAELEGLAQQHHQYDVLSGICHSLEELDDLGAAPLFWGEYSSHDDRVERVQHARGNIDAFATAVAGVEQRRESIIGKIGEQNGALDYLHYDLQDLIEEEESRNNEWLLERDSSDPQYRAQVMPWTRGGEEDQRLRRSMATSLAASLAIVLLTSMIALPLVERAEKIVLPERIAKLVRQERALPPPPPVEEPMIPQEELPEPELAEEQPETLPESTEVPVHAKVKEPDTREQVKSKGILAFREALPVAQIFDRPRSSVPRPRSAAPVKIPSDVRKG